MGALGGFLARLGGLLGCFGGILRPLGAVLAHLGGVLGRLGGLDALLPAGADPSGGCAGPTPGRIPEGLGY